MRKLFCKSLLILFGCLLFHSLSAQAPSRGSNSGARPPQGERQMPQTQVAVPQTQNVQVTQPGFKVFQFPSLQIPRIDGDFSDWDIVPDSYVVTLDDMWDDSKKQPSVDRSNLYIKVKVGWVEGLNRLYFYYEAFDNFWHFSELGLSNDTFEVVVDADLSGGPHVDEFRINQEIMSRLDAFFEFQNIHAQNYHIFTPPTEGKDWTMAWGTQQWLKNLPYSNHAYSYDFNPGESGTLKFEFYITPFDYASPEGPEKSIESKLYEGKNIGLCWAVIDYDKVGGGNNGFWNLSQHHQMFGKAEMERLFTLMPLEPQFRRPIECHWSHTIVNDSRTVAFKDLSYGQIDSWRWDFGDGTTSTEQNPIHTYEQDNSRYTVTLYVKGPAGEDHFCKVWDVSVRDKSNPKGNYR